MKPTDINEYRNKQKTTGKLKLAYTSIDTEGKEWSLYVCSYECPEMGDMTFHIWAKSMDDAEYRIAMIQDSAIVIGALYEIDEEGIQDVTEEEDKEDE